MTCNPGVIQSASGSMTLEFELRPPPGLALEDVRRGVAGVVEEISRTAVGMSVTFSEKRARMVEEACGLAFGFLDSEVTT